MTNPDFIVKMSDRTLGGALRTSDLRKIKSKLDGRGFVLLPSDTCYSLAAYAAFDDTYGNINKILRRGKEPISLCASNYEEALKWVDRGSYAALAILENFTPGPITVVCAPSNSVLRKSRFFKNTIGDEECRIGMRISDSIVEREVSATSENYLITTVAVRDPKNNSVITDFERALEIVGAGIKAFGGAGWGAIEGRDFIGTHSTVVVAERNGAVKLIREGAISFREIEAASRMVPSTHYDEW